jgi:hypothetical protein
MSDCKARRCGWGLALRGGLPPYSPSALAGLAGTLPPGCPNSVPVAQIFAAYVAVCNIPDNTAEAAMHSDSAIAVNGFEQGESHCLKYSAIAEVWALFWEAVRSKPAIALNVLKRRARAEDTRGAGQAVRDLRRLCRLCSGCSRSCRCVGIRAMALGGGTQTRGPQLPGPGEASGNREGVSGRPEGPATADQS